MLSRSAQKLTTAFKVRKRWYRVKNQIAKQFAQAGHDDVAEKLRDCQETESKVLCTHCGKSWWVITKCKLRVCPLCSYEESRNRGQMMIALTNQMQFPKLLTLTLPGIQKDARAGIKLLRKNWNKLRRNHLFDKVKGGAYAIELKPKPTGWHVHLHAIIDAPYLPKQKIFTVWKSFFNVSFISIDIRVAQSKEQKKYLAKYVTKNSSFEGIPESIVAWWEAVKGLRLFEVFGTFRTLALQITKKQDEERDVHAVCPYCNASHSVIHARDGPFFYKEAWLTLKDSFLDEDGDSRPLWDIRDGLAMKD